jgi:peptidoglycan/LPS O-acetylase OafA/YrhL
MSLSVARPLHPTSDEGPVAGSASPGRIAVVDGLRGISILFVVAGHKLLFLQGHFPEPARRSALLFVNGNLGVAFFFVVSGFIITSLLVSEREITGHIARLAFYKRRFVRLVPALYAMLGVTLLLAVVVGKPIPLKCSLPAATFTTGVFNSCDWPLAHLWSLTVEEVFYLAWPLLLIRAGRSPRWPILVFVLFACSCRVICYVAEKRGGPALSLIEALRPLKYMDHMAVGGLLGYLFQCSQRRLARFRKSPALWQAMGALMIWVPEILMYHGKGGIVLVPFGGLFEAMGMGLVLATVLVEPSCALGRMLSWAWLVWVGRISYSLYLWQQLFAPSSPLATLAPTLMGFPLALIGMLTAAAASYYLVEKPTHRLAEARGFINARSRPSRRMVSGPSH